MWAVSAAWRRLPPVWKRWLHSSTGLCEANLSFSSSLTTWGAPSQNADYNRLLFSLSRYFRAWTATFISQFVSQLVSFAMTWTNKSNPSITQIPRYYKSVKSATLVSHSHTACPHTTHCRNFCAHCTQQWGQVFWHFTVNFHNFSYVVIAIKMNATISFSACETRIELKWWHTQAHHCS